VIIVFCALYVYEDLGSIKTIHQKKYFMADNCNKKIRESLYTLLFADFFYTYSQRKTYEVPTRYRADTGKVFFIISILKQSSRYRRRQRVGTSRYCYDLYYVPPAIVFFAAERPWFNLGAYWVVKPLKCVFYDLKGQGTLKNSKKFAGMLTN